jgi:hypothetical protein
MVNMWLDMRRRVYVASNPLRCKHKANVKTLFPLDEHKLLRVVKKISIEIIGLRVSVEEVVRKFLANYEAFRGLSWPKVDCESEAQRATRIKCD